MSDLRTPTAPHSDLGRKAELYARHGVPEVWVVDLNAEQLHVLRDPSEGKYADRIVVGPCVMSIPGLAISVDLSALF